MKKYMKWIKKNYLIHLLFLNIIGIFGYKIDQKPLKPIVLDTF